LQFAPHVVSHVSPDLQATVQSAPHATVHVVTPLHDALQPEPPAEHCTLQLAPPSHPHDEPLHAQEGPVHVGMLAVLPLHARTTPAMTTLGMPSARSKKDVFILPQCSRVLAGLRKLQGSQLAEQRFCVHAPLQQSDAALHGAPSMKQLDAHTEMPCAFATHAPAQQSESAAHGKSGGRHCPGPTSHRFDAGSQTPEQQSPPCAHRSAVRLHVVSSAMQLPLSQ
jgi:hypothetical protein